MSHIATLPLQLTGMQPAFEPRRKLNFFRDANPYARDSSVRTRVCQPWQTHWQTGQTHFRFLISLATFGFWRICRFAELPLD
jgi:hypothetical protein